jgi:lysozyme
VAAVARPLPAGIIDDLVRDEGEVLHAYEDHLGYTTIGVGRLIDKRRGGGISREESRLLLANDLERFAAGLDAHLPWWRTLTKGRQRVLLNMAFNLGVSGLLTFRNTLAAVREGRYDDAAAGMLKSKWATQVGARAKRLAALMEEG